MLTFRWIRREISLYGQFAPEHSTLVRRIHRTHDVCLYVQHICLIEDYSNA